MHEGRLMKKHWLEAGEHFRMDERDEKQLLSQVHEAYAGFGLGA